DVCSSDLSGGLPDGWFEPQPGVYAYNIAIGIEDENSDIEVPKIRVKKMADPLMPVISQSGSCDIEGFFTIPDVKGVIYYVDGVERGAGDLIIGPGTFKVTAKAKPGFELDKPFKVEITLAPADDCVTPVSPVVIQSEACGVNDSFTIPDTEGVVYF